VHVDPTLVVQAHDLAGVPLHLHHGHPGRLDARGHVLRERGVVDASQQAEQEHETDAAAPQKIHDPSPLVARAALSGHRRRWGCPAEDRSMLVARGSMRDATRPPRKNHGLACTIPRALGVVPEARKDRLGHEAKGKNTLPAELYEARRARYTRDAEETR